MSKHHSYFRNGREIDESEAFDRNNGCLRDGVSTRVSMQFRDARMTDLQRSVAADAANRRPVYGAFGGPAGNRPGAVFTNDRAAREAKARAYAAYDFEIQRAWQQTNPRVKSAVATGAGSNGPREQEWQARPDSRDDADADAALEAAFQQTATYHEGGRGLDALMRDHQTNMATIYAAYDNEMSAAWRRS